MKEPIIPIRSTTQSFIEIEDIDNNIVMFSDGSCALIVAVAAVNFGLLSEKEQEAIIYAYAGFLNSLSFPIELLVRSQRKDIAAYLKLLGEKEKNQANQMLVKSIHSYRLFIESTVKEKDVLDKKFYIIIPFSGLELGVSTKNFFPDTNRRLPFPKPYIYERALTVLVPKRDHVLRLLTRLGLRAQQLTSDQITQLFFSIYNQGVPVPQTISVGKRNKEQTKP